MRYAVVVVVVVVLLSLILEGSGQSRVRFCVCGGWNSVCPTCLTVWVCEVCFCCCCCCCCFALLNSRRVWSEPGKILRVQLVFVGGGGGGVCILPMVILTADESHPGSIK